MSSASMKPLNRNTGATTTATTTITKNNAQKKTMSSRQQQQVLHPKNKQAKKEDKWLYTVMDTLTDVLSVVLGSFIAYVAILYLMEGRVDLGNFPLFVDNEGTFCIPYISCHENCFEFFPTCHATTYSNGRSSSYSKANIEARSAPKPKYSFCDLDGETAVECTRPFLEDSVQFERMLRHLDGGGGRSYGDFQAQQRALEQKKRRREENTRKPRVAHPKNV